MSDSNGELVPHDGADGKQLAGGNVDIPKPAFVRTEPALDLVRLAIATQTHRGGAASSAAIVELLIDDSAGLRARLKLLQERHDALQSDHARVTNELTKAQTLLEANQSIALMGKACIVVGGLLGSVAVEIYRSEMVGAGMLLGGLAILSTILGLAPSHWLRSVRKEAP